MKLYFDDRNRGGRVKEEKNGVKCSVAPLATFSNTWHPFSASAQTAQASAYNVGNQVRSLGREDLLEKEVAPQTPVLSPGNPMEEPGRLQSMGSQRVGHD